MKEELKIIHKCGDRDKNQYSESNIAYTIPANPMSDTVQMVVEQIPLNGTPDGVASTLTTGHDSSKNITNPKGGHKQMGVLEIEHLNPINTTKEGYAKCVTATYYKDRKCNIEGHHKGNAVMQKKRIRKLTERECFRLMGVGETDIDTIQQSGVSMSQQYKMAGNSIVVDVLYHLFRKMFVETQNESRQLTLF